MTNPSDLSRPIVESLYNEALVLADEARQLFDIGAITSFDGALENDERLALSVEGLRATTRIMHVLAWLLNHRAYFSGEMTMAQLRRHAQLPPDKPSDRGNLALLNYQTRELIHQTERIHAQIVRLDTASRKMSAPPPVVHQMAKILEQSFR